MVIYDQEVRHRLRARQQTLPPSSFTWGKDFFDSCQADNLKRLDLTTYFALRSTVSKQLYRFLDKKFYLRHDWTFDLKELAFERVGLSRNYAVGNIKQKLQPALEELESIGFLEAMTTADRYAKVGRGAWRIRLVRKRPSPATPKPEPGPEPTGLEKELIDRGVSRGVAAELVRDHPEAQIRIQLANLDGRQRKVKDPGAWLASAIRMGFAVKTELQAVKAEPVVVAVADQAGRRRAQTVRAFWEGLTVEERERIDAEALAQADPAIRAEIEGERRPSMRRLLMSAVREDYLKSLPDVPLAG